jgi:hypothetical protein
MGIIETAKEIASTIQKIDNIELYRQIQNLQQEIQDLVDENSELRKRAREAHDLLTVQQQLEFDHNAYWRALEDGEKQGPFCSNCWDGHKKLIRMHISTDPDYATCPSCDTEVNVTGHYGATIDQIPPSL